MHWKPTCQAIICSLKKKKTCLALGGCKLDKNLFFRAFIILVLNIVRYDSVVCLIHQMESILIAICPIILWKQSHQQIWTAAFPNTCSAAERAPVLLPPAPSQAWQTARFYVIPGVDFQLGSINIQTFPVASPNKQNGGTPPPSLPPGKSQNMQTSKQQIQDT